jgi:hypothetical protein
LSDIFSGRHRACPYESNFTPHTSILQIPIYESNSKIRAINKS